jgi:hypothetical protein
VRWRCYQDVVPIEIGSIGPGFSQEPCKRQRISPRLQIDTADLHFRTAPAATAFGQPENGNNVLKAHTWPTLRAFFAGDLGIWTSQESALIFFPIELRLGLAIPVSSSGARLSPAIHCGSVLPLRPVRLQLPSPGPPRLESPRPGRRCPNPH